jgi:predicted nucleotidyltransferase
MVVTPAQRQFWRQIRQEAIASAQARERAARRLASEAAALLRQAWPGIEGVWLFGSVAEGRTRSSSDVDLAVAGLPPEALLTATAELDSLAAEAAHAAPPVIPIDLVRLESLPPHWQQRIRERAIVL